MRSLLLPLVLLCALSSALAQSPSSASDPLLIKDVQIVDPAKRTVTRGSVLVRDGVIADILKSAPAKFVGRVIEGNGRWLMPGLHDMHVHSFGNTAPGNQMQIMGPLEAAKTMLYAGVTTFLDLYSAEDQIFEVRDRQRASGLLASDIYCAGPILTCTGGHGTEYGIPTRTIDSPEEARRVVTDLATRKPDVVKIVYDHAVPGVPTIDKATLEAAVKTSKELGLKTVIHIGTWQDAKEAVMAGATSITHVYGLEDVPADLVALMKKNRASSIPTLVVQTDFFNITRTPALLDSRLLAQVADRDIIDAYRDTARFDRRSKVWLTWMEKSRESVIRSVKKLYDGGVTIMAGSDVGNLGTFQGWSLHRELELLVAAGMPTWSALASATTIPGAYLGEKVGMQRGDIASFILLDASPVEDIRNTQKISGVIYHGVAVDREELLNPTAKVWTQAQIDDFSDATLVSDIGQRWSLDVDTLWGGSSTIQIEHRDGALRVRGTAKPYMGRPGIAGISLMFDDDGTPFDVSAYDGVRLRITPVSGQLTLKLLSLGVKNFDYHTAVVPSSSEPTEIELTFEQFRQFWSAPIPWTGKDMRGIALWVNAMTPTEYEFIIDSIELY